ncbi:putative disease resistance protein RGA4 [Curcuma longa]|uniref:putative disease resistance protein RGA4 n=1 Tax=Curcuma longa TaxID=136217 RepID=UPI003D9DD9B8
MAASRSAASSLHHSLFPPLTLLSTIHRLDSYLSSCRTPPPSSDLHRHLRSLHASLVGAAKRVDYATRLPSSLKGKFTDAVFAADDLVDQLEYESLQKQVEEMEKTEAEQEVIGREIVDLSVFRGFQTGEDDDAANPKFAAPSSSTSGSLRRSALNTSVETEVKGAELTLGSNTDHGQDVDSRVPAPSICCCFCFSKTKKPRETRSSRFLSCCLGFNKGSRSTVNGNHAAKKEDSITVAAGTEIDGEIGSGTQKNDHSSSQASNSERQKISLEEIIADRIMKIVESLDIISAHLSESMGIAFSKRDLESPHEILPKEKAASSLSLGEVFLYNDEKEQLVKELLKFNEDNVCIFPILGLGGVGKTTLAHFVYQDERIDKYFHTRVWICASDDLNSMRIAGVTANPPSISTPLATREVEKLEFLVRNLQDQLKEKRFLLVLDDVESIEWVTQFASLKDCGKGSKIVITAREEGVIDERGKGNKILLKGLKENPFLSFFNRCAFNCEDPQNYSELQVISKRISSLLNGNPLAAKAVGGLLQTEFTDAHWTRILNELLELEDGLTDIVPVLMLCYNHLPPHLKWCFAYCSVFSKGYPFDAQNLINMWISLGFVQLTDSNKTVEDVGQEYLDGLLSRSFLELPIYNRSYWRSRYYAMHNLMHDLSKSVGVKECLVYENETTYQLYLDRWIYFRSFICNSENLINFGVLSRIRVLDLSYSGMKQLSNSIGDCIHLKYLNLDGNDLYKLPESLCKLYHLQFLVIPEKCHRLPKGTNNLINLRHLNASEEAIAWIANKGRLVRLQELKKFHVRLNKGYDIGQLKDLIELKGELCIQDLDDVGRKEEVIKADLNGKTRIEKLQLKWRTWRKERLRIDAQEVLECLKPPLCLKQLEIHCFGGSQSPGWLEDQSLKFLQSIHLKSCNKWNQLPPFGHLPHLEVLKIEGMNVIVDGGTGMIDPYPSLREIYLHNTSIMFEGISCQEQCCKCFLKLKKLVAVKCKKVGGLPPLALLSSLEELEIKRSPDLESELSGCLKHLKSLTTLKISAPNLTHFPCQVLQHLKYLEIDGCQSLVSWLIDNEEDVHHSSLVSLSIVNSPLPEGPVLVRFLTSIRELQIDQCIKISSFSKEQKEWFASLTSLEKLSISNCVELRELPPNLHRLLSLKQLIIQGCPNLDSLPSSMPESLKVFEISKCNSVLVSQLLGEEAPDWIKCIPFRSIA